MNFSQWFSIKERNTNWSTEILAGVTTFLTMMYIVIVNPTMFAAGGMDFGGVYLATIAAVVIATLIMGIVANYPIAIGPGIGINAYLVYTVMRAGGVAWQSALGAALLASGLFIVLSLTSFREMLINSIPESLKMAMGAGIGLFVALIGLENGGLLVGSTSSLVTMGDVTKPTAALTIFGLFITMGLTVLRIKGAIFLGLVVTALVAWGLGELVLPEHFFSMPHGLEHTFLQLSFQEIHLLPMVIFTLLLVTLFDTTGTMLGIGRQAGLIKDGKFPHLKSALLADSIGSFCGAIFGTGPTSAYVESGTGVSAGGRTGFASVVTAVLFLLLIFCEPIAECVAAVPAITAPALILSGAFMVESLVDIDWHDSTEAFPAFFTIVGMPLTFSIANGVGMGIIIYALLKLVSGQGKTVHPLLYLLAILFASQIYYQ